METNLQYLLERGLQVETNYLSNAPHVFKDIEGFPYMRCLNLGKLETRKQNKF